MKVIAITGGGLQSAVGYLRAAGLLGAAKVLAKPFTCEALLEAVNALVGPPAPAGSNPEAKAGQ